MHGGGAAAAVSEGGLQARNLSTSRTSCEVYVLHAPERIHDLRSTCLELCVERNCGSNRFLFAFLSVQRAHFCRKGNIQTPF